MDFLAWMYGILALILILWAALGLATGRADFFGRANRSGQPIRYWLSLAAIALLAAFTALLALRAQRGDDPIPPTPFLFLPILLWWMAATLRSGEVRFGSNCIPRAQRAQAYWTLLAIAAAAVAFLAFAVIRSIETLLV